MRTATRLPAAIFLLALALMGCASPQELLQADKPERAYTASKRQVDSRLKRRKPFKGPEIRVLADSYAVLQDRHIRRIEALGLAQAPARWLEIHPLYEELLARRIDIDPYLAYLPGLDPRYEVASLQALVAHARKQAGGYYLSQAEALYPEARAGDKAAAREAYHWTRQAAGYLPEKAAELAAHEQNMWTLGMVRVWVSPMKTSGFYDDHLLEAMLDGRRPEYTKWLEVHYQQPPEGFDYRLYVEPAHIYVGWDEERRHTEVYRKEVVQGYRTERKEVRINDSTTVIVTEQVPIIVTVEASITTVELYKWAEGSIRLLLTDAKGAALEVGQQLSTSTYWEHTYQICSGDSRALPCSCSGIWSTHPSGWSMVRDLANSLHGQLHSHIRGSFPEAAGRHVQGPERPERRRRWW